MVQRRSLILAGMALLAGSQGAYAQSAAPGDMAIGGRDAPVTLIEYLSVTCGHCKHFHDTVWPELRANYIDNGRIRFIFREYPTNPAPVAVAGFQLARCGGASPAEYARRVDTLFDRQSDVHAAASSGDAVRQLYVEIGAGFGLSQSQVEACISDPAGAERIRTVVEAGRRDFEVSGTPTFILNGQKLDWTQTQTYATFAPVLDAALAAGR